MRDATTPASPGPAGARILRHLLIGLSGTIFLTLALAAAYIHLRALSPGDIYAGYNHGATLTYLLFWSAAALLALLAALPRRWAFLSFYVLLLIAAEGMSQVYYHLAKGKFYRPIPIELFDRYDPHPLLVGIPRPGRYGEISHDAMHHRTTVNLGKAADAKPIYLFGGSTTYDVGIGDDKTWASDLSAQLGPGYDVVNWGVPGYSSLENLIESLFAFRERKPVCALYYLGWNDLHMAHVTTLRNDYSDYHLHEQAAALAVGHQPGFLERNMLVASLARSVFAPDAETVQARPQGEISGRPDERLTAIYVENLKLIALVARASGVKPIFIPQVLNYDRLTDDQPMWWAPLIPQNEIKPLMQGLNEALMRTASELGVDVIEAPLDVAWQDSDFVDQTHFAPTGAEKFARAIRDDVLSDCR
jgi:hypothetical protein